MPIAREGKEARENVDAVARQVLPTTSDAVQFDQVISEWHILQNTYIQQCSVTIFSGLIKGHLI